MGDVLVQWQRLAEGLTPSIALRPIIAESWRRCAAAEVDPIPARVVLRRVSDEELEQRRASSAPLLELARPHMEWLSAVYARLPHVAYLVDRDGIVLHAIGTDHDAVRTLGQPGSDWSEANTGTNGAGTALVAGEPVAVEGAEHFVRAWHAYTCTGAPVRGPDGEVIGAIDLSTAAEHGSAERLLVVGHAAYAISQELRAHDALQRFRGAFDHAAVGMALTNPDGRWSRVNQALCETLGYTEGELLDRTFQSLTHPDDVAANVDLLHRVLAGEVDHCQVEKRLVHKQGHAVWVSMSAAAVRDARGAPQYFVTQLQDISERKRAEEALRESEVRHRTLVETAHEGIWVVDQVGVTSYVNPRLCRMLGYAPAELLGRQIFDFMPDEAAFEARTLFARRQRGIAEVHELSFRCRDGRELFALVATSPLMDADGSFAGALAMITDITERRRAEQALRESEARYRLATRATNDVVYDWNVPDDQLFWGDTLMDAFGYDPKQVAASNGWWEERLHPEDASPVIASLDRALEGDASAWSEEYRFRRRDGSYATVLDRGYLLRDDEGRPIRLVGSMIDLSERKELEAQLRQSQKMEAVGQLAGGVAHDFNNLLTVITLHSDLALEELESEHPLAPHIEEIRKGATRAASLTRQLLAFSRKQLLAPQVLDLNVVVDGLEPMLRRLIGEDVGVGTRLAPRLGLVLADPGQLEQVLVNLAVNARDAMAGGGTLIIATTDVEIDESRPLPGVPPGDYVTLAVTDSGCGMSPEVQGRIFEPFFTTKPVGQGTGLGLSTVYGIVKQSGGHIAVDSEPGRGTTFTIFLPRIVPESSGTSVDLPATPGRSRGTETVLLVEDEEAVRRLARRILERQGYSVLEASNGRDAMAITQRHHGAIDIVLTDVVMPEMSGRALAEQLGAAHPGLRVLFMSGYTDDEILRRGLLDADTRLLSKPFTADALAEAVRAALRAPHAVRSRP